MNILSKIKKILINLILIIVSIIAIIVVYAFLQMNIFQKEYVNIFGFSIFQVATGSMSDTMEIDDIIVVKLNNNEINTNDIITFKENDHFVTHRVISKDAEHFITKGDANTNEDAPITKNDIIGKVVFIVSNVAIWKKVFTDTRVIISLAITVILFIIVIAYKEKIGENNA